MVGGVNGDADDVSVQPADHVAVLRTWWPQGAESYAELVRDTPR